MRANIKMKEKREQEYVQQAIDFAQKKKDDKHRAAISKKRRAKEEQSRIDLVNSSPGSTPRNSEDDTDDEQLPIPKNLSKIPYEDNDSSQKKYKFPGVKIGKMVDFAGQFMEVDRLKLMSSGVILKAGTCFNAGYGGRLVTLDVLRVGVHFGFNRNTDAPTIVVVLANEGDYDVIEMVNVDWIVKFVKEGWVDPGEREEEDMPKNYPTKEALVEFQETAELPRDRKRSWIGELTAPPPKKNHNRKRHHVSESDDDEEAFVKRKLKIKNDNKNKSSTKKAAPNVTAPKVSSSKEWIKPSPYKDKTVSKPSAPEKPTKTAEIEMPVAQTTKPPKADADAVLDFIKVDAAVFAALQKKCEDILACSKMTEEINQGLETDLRHSRHKVKSIELDAQHRASLWDKEKALWDQEKTVMQMEVAALQAMIARLKHTIATLTQEEPVAALTNSGRTSPRSAHPPIMHAAQPTGQYFAPAPQVNPMGGQQLQLPAPAGWMQVPNTTNWNY